MAFTGDIDYLGAQGNTSKYGNLRMWLYTTDDSASEVNSNGYFNKIAQNLTTGDIIWVRAVADYYARRVVSVGGIPVVTSAVDANGGNNISGHMRYLYFTTDGGASITTTKKISEKIQIVDVIVQLNGAGTTNDTFKIQKGANDVTNAIDISGADKSIVRVGTIDNAYSTFSEGDSISFTQTDGGGNNSPSCLITVVGLATY